MLLPFSLRIWLRVCCKKVQQVQNNYYSIVRYVSLIRVLSAISNFIEVSLKGLNIHACVIKKYKDQDFRDVYSYSLFNGIIQSMNIQVCT